MSNVAVRLRGMSVKQLLLAAIGGIGGIGETGGAS